ncbi:prepilin peptidase [Vibrio sp. RE86]|uniref:prepilin peptidase n=1 Tax=Vibrio sp. RE86 TaxID=2607605 RepID=UPI0014934751|nr:prepilin peptidase [Vibrio sp. RE86]
MFIEFMIDAYRYVVLFLLGATLFSFIQCVGTRVLVEKWPLRLALLGRSRCDYCGQELTLKEYFPLLSSMFLKGKTRCCRKNLHIKYFTGEFVSGVTLCTLGYLLHFSLY